MRKTKILMNKPAYLGQSILDISKTLIYEFWYDYIKPKYQEKAKLCYMDTDSFFIHIETEDFYKDTANDVNEWSDTSGYTEKDERPLPIAKNKKVIGKFKDESNEKIIKEFCALRAKTYASLLDDEDDDTEEKKSKGTKECVIKKVLTFENYKDSLLIDKIITKSQQRFKRNHHAVGTEEVNEIGLSSNDDKRIQTYDKVNTYPYRTSVFKVCESEMLAKRKDILIKYK